MVTGFDFMATGLFIWLLVWCYGFRFGYMVIGWLYGYWFRNVVTGFVIWLLVSLYGYGFGCMLIGLVIGLVV